MWPSRWLEFRTSKHRRCDSWFVKRKNDTCYTALFHVVLSSLFNFTSVNVSESPGTMCSTTMKANVPFFIYSRNKEHIPIAVFSVW